MEGITREQFVTVWNTAGTLTDVVEDVCTRTGRRVARWTVLARAVAYRSAGGQLKALPDETPPRSAVVRTRELAAKLFAAHGLVGWEFGFNRNVRRAGVCRYPTRARPGRIELSRHFVERNPDAEVLDTLLHEIAHALVGPEHGHDAAWKAKCREVGARPERCYGEQVEMPVGRWQARCPSCARQFDRHRRPARLTGWYCRPCGKDRGPLRWAETA